MKRWAFGVLLCWAIAAAGATAPPAAAQSGPIGQVLEAPSASAELRARQAALFEQLAADPDNLDLMFDYAQVSIQVEDYEAAIATLERMLIYRQDLGRVRLELAVAYFNLGSYAIAQLYFEQVLDDPATPDPVRARIRRYLSEIDQRTRRHAVSGVATVGITHSTNATLGPDSNRVLFLGNVATLISGQQEADTGLRVTLNLAHVYDLGQADDDVWRTDLDVYSLRYFDTEQGNIVFTRARTGPRLSLDTQQFGPKVRPYVEAQYLHSNNRGLFSGFAAGAEASNTLSPVLSAYGDVGLRYRNYFRQEFADEDGYTVYGLAGLAYLPVRDVVLRGAVLAELDSATGDQNSNQEIGLRLSGEYFYDTGLSWVDQKWAAAAYVDVRGRFFEEPDPLIDPATTRRDIDLRGGVRHIFAIRDGFGVQIEVDGLLRQSNVVNFDLDNLSATLSLRYRL